MVELGFYLDVKHGDKSPKSILKSSHNKNENKNNLRYKCEREFLLQTWRYDEGKLNLIIIILLLLYYCQSTNPHMDSITYHK